MFEQILSNRISSKPLVYCITTLRECANVISASPIMADDENQMEEITSIYNALVWNAGTLNERTIKSVVKPRKQTNHSCSSSN